MISLRIPSIAICLLAVGAFAEISQAATVEVRSSRGSDLVRYVAAPGEHNDLTFEEIDSWPTAFLVRDPGATITVGSGCVSVDTHSAVCIATSGAMYHTRVQLGDGDDILHPVGFNLLVADGGPGNDRLLGGTWDDRLDGGGGTDELRGGEGADTLSDGDRDDAPELGRPGPDILDGGAGEDALSYDQRKTGVRVDLADAGPDGAPGERDLVLDIESVTGGAGDDRLAGDGSANILHGGRGRNRIVGRAGDDTLVRPSTSTARCGTGRDTVRRPGRFTVIPHSCELLQWPLPRDVWSDDTFLDLVPYPARRSGQRGFEIECPDIDGEPLSCSAEIRIRERSSGRLLARGGLPERSPYVERFLRLQLTQFGRDFMSGDRSGAMTAQLSGESMPTARWTIRCVRPRSCLAS